MGSGGSAFRHQRHRRDALVLQRHHLQPHHHRPGRRDILDSDTGGSGGDINVTANITSDGGPITMGGNGKPPRRTSSPGRGMRLVMATRRQASKSTPRRSIPAAGISSSMDRDLARIEHRQCLRHRSASGWGCRDFRHGQHWHDNHERHWRRNRNRLGQYGGVTAEHQYGGYCHQW